MERGEERMGTELRKGHNWLKDTIKNGRDGGR